MTATSSYLNLVPRSERQARVDRLGIYIHVFFDREDMPTTAEPCVGYDDALESLAEATGGGWADRHSLRYAQTIVVKCDQATTTDMSDALAQVRRDEREDERDYAGLRTACPR